MNEIQKSIPRTEAEISEEQVEQDLEAVKLSVRDSEGIKNYDNDHPTSDPDIRFSYRDAYLSMQNKDNGKYKGDGINYHNIGKEGMKSAIESFDRPEQVLLSKKDGKIELVLEGADRKGNRLLSVVALNTSTRNAQKFIEAHIVTSIYGKRSIERYVNKAESEGRLIYTKKEEPAQGISQVQYEGNINAVSLKTIVHDGKASVKHQDRDTESVSNSSLLANALVGAAQNDIEQQRLRLSSPPPIPKKKPSLRTTSIGKGRQIMIDSKIHLHPYRMHLDFEGLSHGGKTCHRHVF